MSHKTSRRTKKTLKVLELLSANYESFTFAAFLEYFVREYEEEQSFDVKKGV